MKYIIKDINKEEVLTTTDLKEAYEDLQKGVPAKNLPSYKHMQGSVNRDKKWEREPVPYGFLGDGEDVIMYMDVYYNE